MPPPLTSIENEVTLRQVAATAREINASGDLDDATDYLRGLEGALGQYKITNQQLGLADAYGEIITYLQFVSLPLLDDRTLEDLFRTHLLAGLRSDVDLKTKLDLLLLLRQDEFRGRALRRQIVRAISENQEPLGPEPLTIPDPPSVLPPAVASWLLDFLRSGSLETQQSNLEIANYLAQNANAKRLSQDEQALVRQLLTVYVYLLSSPLATYAANALRERPPTGPQRRPMTEDFRTVLLRSLFEEAEGEATVFAEEERLLAGGPYRFGQVAEALRQGLVQHQSQRVVAALFLLARSGDLLQLLARDTALAAAVERDLLPSLLAELKRQHQSLTLEGLQADFRRQPVRPAYLLLVLKHWLTAAHGGDAAMAARVGARLAGLLLEHGYRDAAHLAYFDAGARQYRWGTIAVDSQGVPLLQ